MKRWILIVCLAITASTAQAKRVRIVVGGANFRPFPVAAPALVSLGGDGPEARNVMNELTETLQGGVDLVRSLELIAPRTYLAPDAEPWNRPNFPNWTNVGAAGLIRGGVNASGKQLEISFRFYDVVAQRELLTKTYRQSPEDARQAVYDFLDQVVEVLTGERGIFSSRLAYVKRTKNGKAVFISNIDGRDPRRITEPSALSLLPAWDPSARYVLFTSYLRDNPDLYRIRLGDGHLEWLSNKRGPNMGAAVSPDGKQIALTLSIDGNTEVYVMDRDGGNLRRLTDSWGQDLSPTWSPDGTRIAFVSSRSGNPHLYIMGADGSSPRRLTFQGTYNQEPDWSPKADGEIAFTARDERNKFDVFRVHPESGEITRLTHDEGNNESPSHSPDGHHLVFTSTRPPGRGRQLYIMDIDGQNQRHITRGDGDHETPAWSWRAPN